MAKGDADAAVLQKKAEAYKLYGEAAVVQMIVEQLPKLAAAIAKPLANTEKMVRHVIHIISLCVGIREPSALLSRMCHVPRACITFLFTLTRRSSQLCDSCTATKPNTKRRKANTKRGGGGYQLTCPHPHVMEYETDLCQSGLTGRLHAYGVRILVPSFPNVCNAYYIISAPNTLSPILDTDLL